MSSLVLNVVPLPTQDPIAHIRRPEFRDRKDPREGQVTQPWVDYFTALGTSQEASPIRIAQVGVTAQSASIAATDMSNGNLSGGFYAVSFYARITQAATTSSSLEVIVDWTEGGLAQSHTFAAITGNTVTSLLSDGLPLILVDPLSPIRYSTTYASVGGTVMQYELYIVLTQVQA